MPTRRKRKHSARLQIILFISAFAALTWCSFLAADTLRELDEVRNFIASYGYLSILTLAIFAGLNAFVPVPAATFVPVFTQAGLWLPLIILMLVIGTTIADLLGYWFGRISREYFSETHPKLISWLSSLHDRHIHWTFPVVAAYAAIIPLPNELILIPLAIMGSNIRFLITALIIGNVIHQSALAYGFENIFRMFF